MFSRLRAFIAFHGQLCAKVYLVTSLSGGKVPGRRVVASLGNLRSPPTYIISFASTSVTRFAAFFDPITYSSQSCTRALCRGKSAPSSPPTTLRRIPRSELICNVECPAISGRLESNPFRIKILACPGRQHYVSHSRWDST